MTTIQRTPKKRQATANPKRPAQGKPQQDLVYRHIPHQSEKLVFSPRARALHVHLIWTAINHAKTWGDFIDMLPPGEWHSLEELLENKPTNRETVFFAESLPGYSDGDYPPWLQTEMDRCIPNIVLEEFGLRESSVINGPFWTIPTEIELPFVDRLKQLGYAVELRDDWYFY